MTNLDDICTRFAAHLLNDDLDAAESAYAEFNARLPESDPAELAAAIDVVASRLESLSLSEGQQLALIGGRLVEQGAPAVPLMRAVEPKVIDGLMWAAIFPRGWEAASYGAPLPDPEDDEVIVEDVLDQLMRNLAHAEMTEEEANSLTEAWFSVGSWMQAMVAAAQPTDGRRAMVSKDEVIDALAPIYEDYSEQFSAAYWLNGLLLVLDDEPLIVLHRASGSGYRVTIGGIGDNFQLHTLLADRLVGNAGSGLIYDVRPEPEWVAAADTGADLEPAGGIDGQFDLIDAYGDMILNEERPYDIPELDGVRVVVLDPLPHPRNWNAGRVYASMPPTVRLDEIMPAAEAAQWLERVKVDDYS